MADALLMEMFGAAVESVSGATATRQALLGYPHQEVYIAAVGKAAGGMVRGALDVLDDRIISALVISKYEHIEPDLKADSRLHCIESAHPVPDHNSLHAADELVKYLEALPASAHLVFLLSGGASALIESLPDGMTLQDLQRVSHELLSTGLDINQMNQVRRALSGIKGGRLASHLAQVSTLQLVISDVPGDALAAIGSGPLVPPTQERVELPGLPDWLSDMISAAAPGPDPEDPVWQQVETKIVASNSIACAAAATHARAAGLHVVQAQGELTGDVVAMADSIAATLSAPDAAPGIYIWGGETTVMLPAHPGRGGRNQQLALQLLLAMPAGRIWRALCCGTDGSDGPTGDAGGLVDQSILEAGQTLGLDAEDFSRRANAGEYLQKVGALVTTGPTGTNVMDLVIAVLE